MPRASSAIVIHGALLAAVQLHAASVVTSNDPLPPPASKVADAEDRLYTHAIPDCVIGIVAPAALMVAVRPAVVVFGPTVKAKRPSPAPAGDCANVTHGALDSAVHPQTLAAFTLTVPGPPAAAKDVASADAP